MHYLQKSDFTPFEKKTKTLFSQIKIYYSFKNPQRCDKPQKIIKKTINQSIDLLAIYLNLLPNPLVFLVGFKFCKQHFLIICISNFNKHFHIISSSSNFFITSILLTYTSHSSLRILHFLYHFFSFCDPEELYATINALQKTICCIAFQNSLFLMYMDISVLSHNTSLLCKEYFIFRMRKWLSK